MRPRARAEAIARSAGSVPAAVRALAAAGFTKVEAVKALRAAFGIGREEATRAVHEEAD